MKMELHELMVIRTDRHIMLIKTVLVIISCYSALRDVLYVHY